MTSPISPVEGVRKPSIVIKRVRGDHNFDLSDSFSTAKKVITQAAYYKGNGFILAIGELNHPNCWNDKRFDAICSAIQAACNGASR